MPNSHRHTNISPINAPLNLEGPVPPRLRGSPFLAGVSPTSPPPISSTSSYTSTSSSSSTSSSTSKGTNGPTSPIAPTKSRTASTSSSSSASSSSSSPTSRPASSGPQNWAAFVGSDVYGYRPGTPIPPSTGSSTSTSTYSAFSSPSPSSSSSAASSSSSLSLPLNPSHFRSTTVPTLASPKPINLAAAAPEVSVLGGGIGFLSPEKMAHAMASRLRELNLGISSSPDPAPAPSATLPPVLSLVGQFAPEVSVFESDSDSDSGSFHTAPSRTHSGASSLSPLSPPSHNASPLGAAGKRMRPRGQSTPSLSRTSLLASASSADEGGYFASVMSPSSPGVGSGIPPMVRERVTSGTRSSSTGPR